MMADFYPNPVVQKILYELDLFQNPYISQIHSQLSDAKVETSWPTSSFGVPFFSQLDKKGDLVGAVSIGKFKLRRLRSRT